MVEARVIDVLKSFEKIDPAKLTTSADLVDDLGLDSVDVMEVAMALGEEFKIEIPDEEVENFKTLNQFIDFIASQPDAK